MKNHHHPWNLRRIFGSQSVGCVAGSPRPEAGIVARVIPAQSSRRTFRGPSDADLATWRLGDLVVDDQRDSSPRTLLRPQLRRFVHLQQECRGACLNPSLENTQALPRPSNCSDISSGVTARPNLPQFSVPHWEQRGTPKDTLPITKH